MRLFIALPVTDGMRRALLQTETLLRKKGVTGRFTPPENLHMTLVFLGNVSDPAPVIEAVKSVRLPEQTLFFDRLTVFGDVLVALYRHNDAIDEYVKSLQYSPVYIENRQERKHKK